MNRQMGLSRNEAYQWIWGVPPFWTCLKKLPLGGISQAVQIFVKKMTGSEALETT